MAQWKIDALNYRLYLLSGAPNNPPLSPREISQDLRSYAQRVLGATNPEIDAYLDSQQLPR